MTHRLASVSSGRCRGPGDLGRVGVLVGGGVSGVCVYVHM